MKPTVFWQTLRESAALFWEARNARERTILAGGGALVSLCLVYAIFFAPALNGRAHLSKDLPVLRQQALELQTLARHAADLHNAVAPAAPVLSQESVAASLLGVGMKPQSLSVTDELVRIQLNPVSFAGLTSWLNQQRLAMRLEVVEANFVALPQNDMVNATVTLRQQRGAE